MGRVRRYGYFLEWYIGDHIPRHVHVFNSKGSQDWLGAMDTGQKTY